MRIEIDLNPLDGIDMPTITDGDARIGECDWLFKPAKIRDIFKI